MAQKLAASAWKVIPFLQSRDIARTRDFYLEKLGFLLGGVKPETASSDQPLTFCSIYAGKKAAVNMYYTRVEEGHQLHLGSVMIAMGTDELDALHDHLRADGTVPFVEDIWNTEWGFRQFAIDDPDGNRLTFFKFLEGGNPGSE